MRATRKHGWLKALDRYAGIPLVAAMAPLRIGRRLERARIGRIGLMKTAAIGDTVLLSGPAVDVRAAFPEAEIAIITGHDNAGVMSLLPFHVDTHVVVSPSRPLAAVRDIRRAALDVIIDFGSWPRFDAMLAALSGASWRIGFDTRGQGRRAAYDAAMTHSSALHEIDNYRRLVALLGVDAHSPPSLRADPSLNTETTHRPYVVFHPWSGGERHEVKEWASSRWIELATRISPRYAVVVTGGSGDIPRTQLLVGDLQRAGATAFAAHGSLAQTAALLQGSAVVISVNTGIMHVAAAVGARTVSLEGPVPVARWGPIGKHVTSVVSTYPGCEYLNLGFEYAGQRMDCMEGVSVDAVHEAVEQLIARSE